MAISSLVSSIDVEDDDDDDDDDVLLPVKTVVFDTSRNRVFRAQHVSEWWNGVEVRDMMRAARNVAKHHEKLVRRSGDDIDPQAAATWINELRGLEKLTLSGYHHAQHRYEQNHRAVRKEQQKQKKQKKRNNDQAIYKASRKSSLKCRQEAMQRGLYDQQQAQLIHQEQTTTETTTTETVDHEVSSRSSQSRSSRSSRSSSESSPQKRTPSTTDAEEDDDDDDDDDTILVLYEKETTPTISTAPSVRVAETPTPPTPPPPAVVEIMPRPRRVPRQISTEMMERVQRSDRASRTVSRTNTRTRAPPLPVSQEMAEIGWY